MPAKAAEEKPKLKWVGETEDQRLDSAFLYHTLRNIMERYGESMTPTERAVIIKIINAQLQTEEEDKNV